MYADIRAALNVLQRAEVEQRCWSVCERLKSLEEAQVRVCRKVRQMLLGTRRKKNSCDVKAERSTVESPASNAAVEKRRMKWGSVQGDFQRGFSLLLMEKYES